MSRGAAAFLLTAGVLFAGITVAKQGRPRADPDPSAEADGASAGERERVLRFWDRYREATAHRIAGRFREAAAGYAEALALDPGHEDALYYYGSMVFDLGDLAGAEEAWQRLVAVNDASARAHSRLGDIYLCYRRPQWFDLAAAEAQFRRAAEINPEETGPLLHLGESALMRGDLAGAQATIDDVLRTNEQSVDAHFLRGYIAWKAARGGEVSEHTARLRELMEQRARQTTGLGEGDTRSGGAMVAEARVCRGVREIVEGLGEGGPVTDAAVTALFHRADTVLADARRAMR